MNRILVREQLNSHYLQWMSSHTYLCYCLPFTYVAYCITKAFAIWTFCSFIHPFQKLHHSIDSFYTKLPENSQTWRKLKKKKNGSTSDFTCGSIFGSPVPSHSEKVKLVRYWVLSRAVGGLSNAYNFIRCRRDREHLQQHVHV